MGDRETFRRAVGAIAIYLAGMTVLVFTGAMVLGGACSGCRAAAQPVGPSCTPANGCRLHVGEPAPVDGVLLTVEDFNRAIGTATALTEMSALYQACDARAWDVAAELGTCRTVVGESAVQLQESTEVLTAAQAAVDVARAREAAATARAADAEGDLVWVGAFTLASWLVPQLAAWSMTEAGVDGAPWALWLGRATGLSLTTVFVLW